MEDIFCIKEVLTECVIFHLTSMNNLKVQSNTIHVRKYRNKIQKSANQTIEQTRYKMNKQTLKINTMKIRTVHSLILCGTKGSSDKPRVRIVETIYFQWVDRIFLFNVHQNSNKFH